MIIIIKTILVWIAEHIGRYSKIDKSVNNAKVLQSVAFIESLMFPVSIVKRQKNEQNMKISGGSLDGRLIARLFADHP